MNTSATPDRDTLFKPADKRRLSIIGGVIAAIGVLAILLPAVATFAGEFIIAWMFTLWGAVGLWFAWEMRPAREWRYAAMAFGLILFIGVVFVLFPFTGIASLTILMMIAFIAEGIASILVGLRTSATLPNWGWLVFSGICSLIVGLIILLGWPETAVWTLGLLIGLNFLSTGISLVMLARAPRAAV